MQLCSVHPDQSKIVGMALYRTLHRFPLFGGSGEVSLCSSLDLWYFPSRESTKTIGFQLRQFVVLHGVEPLNGAAHLQPGVGGVIIVVVKVGKELLFFD